MADLQTTWLGLDLKHPVVAGASPISRTLDGIKQLEDGGASAVVMFSLFEEQITHDSYVLDHYLAYGSESFGEALNFLPDAPGYDFGGEHYLTLVSQAATALDIPVVASLNGVTTGGWARYARELELAGAAALELNIYFVPTDPGLSGADVERIYLETVALAAGQVTIPVTVKISPYFTSTANIAQKFAELGAHGLTLFNRFYQPDFNLETLQAVPSLVLSTSYDLRLPLHWAAILSSQLDVDIAVSGGVHTQIDAVKAILAGATVVQMTSEILQNGPGRLGEVAQAMDHWMTEFEYTSCSQMRGSMNMKHVDDANAYLRTNYMRVLNSFKPDPTGWGR